MAASHVSRDVEQRARIVEGADALRKNDVIARALPLEPSAARGEPRQRVKPVNRANRVADDAEERVVPRDMRAFMQKDRAKTPVAPGARAPRKYDAIEERHRLIDFIAQQDLSE